LLLTDEDDIRAPTNHAKKANGRIGNDAGKWAAWWRSQDPG
jgi:hypothetical protein